MLCYQSVCFRVMRSKPVGVSFRLLTFYAIPCPWSFYIQLMKIDVIILVYGIIFRLFLIEMVVLLFY